MEALYYLLTGVVGLALGLVGGRYLLAQVYGKMEQAARAEADTIVKEAKNEAENIRQQKLLDAKTKFQEMKSKHEQENMERRAKLKEVENTLRQREKTLQQRAEQLKKERGNLEQKSNQVDKQQELYQSRMQEVEKLRQERINQLEQVSNLTREQAQQELAKDLVNEARTNASAEIKEIVEHAKNTATKEAKRIVLQTIQRTAAEHAIENSVTVFNIESDEIKGRIIGREGRNIRALEAATGVEIVVDDTPDAIIISGFDPVRREVARLSLHRLVADGRIHPARIEEVVAKTEKLLTEEIQEIGERACIDLNIHGLHPELTRLVGRMKYRSSYGQNLLQHSREVANLCSTMAAELGLNAKQARRAGLLHDIGKVVEDQPEVPHALLGMQLAEKFGEPEDVCNAIGAHHDEIEMNALISPIIQACDAISGSRPGARREIVENYVQRLQELEQLALSYPGVSKTFAIQAGRELRVIVESEKVSDDQANELAYDISQKIQNDMQYPGQVKVTVIREMRSVSIAK